MTYAIRKYIAVMISLNLGRKYAVWIACVATTLNVSSDVIFHKDVKVVMENDLIDISVSRY